MGTDAQRAKLYTAVAETMGQEAAESMMTLLPPWEHSEVARKDDIDRAVANIDARFAAIDVRFDRLEVTIGAKLDQQFARLLMWTIGVMLAFVGLFVAAASFA